jgi:prepilin-type N-terminal cleavage/methylation domain-containing protein
MNASASVSFRSGFTLIEMLLSISIIGIIAGLSTPLYHSFATRNDLSVVAEETTRALRRANNYSRGAREDSTWGVNFESSTITLYKGNDFASRDKSFDEAIPVPININLNYSGKIVFAKVTGLPSSSESISLVGQDGKTTIRINEEGMVSY